MITISKLKSEVFFYIPSQELIASVPVTIKAYWEWIYEFIKCTPIKLSTGELCDYAGPYNWTVQTYIYLKTYGFPCQLTASLPEEGIIITHSDFLPIFLKPSAKQFIVEIKPDRYLRCVFSNFVIVQNRHDPFYSGVRRFLIKSAFVNYWPQPGLIPRDPGRGDRFENICFMGNPEQFLQENDVLESEVKKLGLNWRMMPREKWHDYSEVDAIIAVRQTDFATSNHKRVPATLCTKRKPAAKLINAWLAGVPAILSPDIAFEDIRRTELDYLRAKNIPEIVENLKLLMSDPLLRSKMTENGKKRSVEFKLEESVKAWIEIIEKQIIPEYTSWKKFPLKRVLLFSTRIWAYKATGIDTETPMTHVFIQKIHYKTIHTLKYLGNFIFKQKCLSWRIKNFLKHARLTKNVV